MKPIAMMPPPRACKRGDIVESGNHKFKLVEYNEFYDYWSCVCSEACDVISHYTWEEYHRGYVERPFPNPPHDE